MSAFIFLVCFLLHFDRNVRKVNNLMWSKIKGWISETFHENSTSSRLFTVFTGCTFWTISFHLRSKYWSYSGGLDPWSCWKQSFWRFINVFPPWGSNSFSDMLMSTWWCHTVHHWPQAFGGGRLHDPESNSEQHLCGETCSLTQRLKPTTSPSSILWLPLIQLCSMKQQKSPESAVLENNVRLLLRTRNCPLTLNVFWGNTVRVRTGLNIQNKVIDAASTPVKSQTSMQSWSYAYRTYRTLDGAERKGWSQTGRRL